MNKTKIPPKYSTVFLFFVRTLTHFKKICENFPKTHKRSFVTEIWKELFQSKVQAKRNKIEGF